MRCMAMIICPALRVVKKIFPSYKGGREGSDNMVHDWKVLRGVELQCDRENREHLKYLRSVKCVMTNHSKYQDT